MGHDEQGDSGASSMASSSRPGFMQLFRNPGLTCAVDCLLVILRSIHVSDPLAFRSEHSSGLRHVLSLYEQHPPETVPGSELGVARTAFYRFLRHQFYHSCFNGPSGGTAGNRHQRADWKLSALGAPTYREYLSIRELIHLITIANSTAPDEWSLADSNIEQSFLGNGCGPKAVDEFISPDFGNLCVRRCKGTGFRECNTRESRVDSVLRVGLACQQLLEPRRGIEVKSQLQLQVAIDRTLVPGVCTDCGGAIEFTIPPPDRLPRVVAVDFFHGRGGMSSTAPFMEPTSLTSFTVGGCGFSIAGAIYYANDHFWCEVRINGRWYFYDDVEEGGMARPLSGTQPHFATQPADSDARKELSVALYQRVP